MSFRTTGLSAEPFRHLYGLSDQELALHGVKSYIADKRPGFPDRIEMRDASVGEKLLLLNHTIGGSNAAHAVLSACARSASWAAFTSGTGLADYK
jgi:hypothetical protein